MSKEYPCQLCNACFMRSIYKIKTLIEADEADKAHKVEVGVRARKWYGLVALKMKLRFRLD